MPTQPNKPKPGRGHASKTLGVTPGDPREFEEDPSGFVLRPQPIDPSLLAPLRGKVQADSDVFDVETFRDEPCDSSMRD